MEGKLDGLGEGFRRLLVDGIDRVDINAGDEQTVGVEDEALVLAGSDDVALFSFVITVFFFITFINFTENCILDNFVGVEMELIEGFTSDSRTNLGSDGLAAVTDKIRNIEDFAFNSWNTKIELPVVGEVELQTSVITSFDNDLVSGEVRTREETQGLDDV